MIIKKVKDIVVGYFQGMLGTASPYPKMDLTGLKSLFILLYLSNICPFYNQ